MSNGHGEHVRHSGFQLQEKTSDPRDDLQSDGKLDPISGR